MCLIPLFIESKETLKIVGFSPYATRTNKNPNKITLSKIGLQLTFSSCMGALDRNVAIDPLLVRTSASALIPWLGHKHLEYHHGES